MEKEPRIEGFMNTWLFGCLKCFFIIVEDRSVDPDKALEIIKANAVHHIATHHKKETK